MNYDLSTSEGLQKRKGIEEPLIGVLGTVTWHRYLGTVTWSVFHIDTKNQIELKAKVDKPPSKSPSAITVVSPELVTPGRASSS